MHTIYAVRHYCIVQLPNSSFKITKSTIVIFVIYIGLHWEA